MSATKFVEFRGRGFWAYDVALGIFLKHLIDLAESRASASDRAWLAKAVSKWRIVAGVGDIGLKIDETWPVAQLSVFIELAMQVCKTLAERDRIPVSEIIAWPPILDDLRVSTRGTEEVLTAPIVELGRAIIALVNDSLPPAPAQTLWFYGTPSGRQTIGMRKESTAPAVPRLSWFYADSFGPDVRFAPQRIA